MPKATDSDRTLHAQVRLPETLEAGRFDDKGKKDSGGDVFIGMGSGICHVWARFPQALAAGQQAEMTFTGVPGAYINTGNFTEWTPGPPGYSFHAIVRKPLGMPPGAKFRGPLEEIGPDTTPMEIDEGTWDVEVEVLTEGPEGEPEIAHGVETNRLVRNIAGDLWLVSAYEAPFRGTTFEQHGIYGYDPNTGHYHASWVKTVQANLAVYQGQWDVGKRLLTLEGKTRSCFGERGPDGKVALVTEQRIVRYQDRNSKTLEVWQTDPANPGEWLARDRVKARRRTDEDPDTHVNVPRVGDGRMELVALQRGWQTARVVGRNAHRGALPAAAGLVMLGPAWNQLYGDTLRLERPKAAGK